MVTEAQLLDLLEDVIYIESNISNNKRKIEWLMFKTEKLETKQQKLREKLECIIKEFNQAKENINSEKNFSFELEIRHLLNLIANELKNLSGLIAIKGMDKYGYLLDFKKYCESKYNNYLTLDFNYLSQEGNPDIDLECSEIYTDILSLLKDIKYEKNRLEITN